MLNWVQVKKVMVGGSGWKKAAHIMAGRKQREKKGARKGDPPFLFLAAASLLQPSPTS